MADGSGGEYQNAQAIAASERGAATGGGCAECHDGNWIHIRYEYTEGDPVTDAVFVVQKANGEQSGGDVIAEGVLSIGPDAEHRFVHVDLGDYDGPVDVLFYDDPTEPAPYSEPAPVEDERGWLRRAADAVVGGAEWIGEVGMGDFNENMSTGQIITNAIVTAVPGIDQVADARDLIANGKYLLWDKRYNELGVWVGVFACLIGLIPSLGSLAKGVIKIIWKNAGEMGRILVYINRALHKTGMRVNGYRKVKEFADEIVAKVGEVSAKFDEFLDDCAAKARFLGMHDMLQSIETVRQMARQKFDEVAVEINARIARGLADFAMHAHRMLPSNSLIVRRVLKASATRGPFPKWQPTMERLGFDASAVEGSAVDMTDDLARKIDGEYDPRVIDAKWAAIEGNMPNDWKGKWSKKDWNDRALRNFDGPAEIREIPDGTPLYRVIGKPGDEGGPWWSFDPPPASEAEWRGRDAVVQAWGNAGGAYVTLKAPPPKHVLVGKAGPKPSVADPTKVLPGGGTQVYVPGFDHPAPAIPDVEKRIAETGGYFHTDWNDRAPVIPSRANVAAGKIDECDK